MARLIDADALLNRFSTEIPIRPVSLTYDMGTVLKAIMDSPTVDAEPVRHGWWVAMRDKTLECSECKCTAPFEADRNGDVVFADEYDYCPWCGAKMDGGDNDEAD